MPIKWVVDPVHSEIQFKVKHLMITTVTGYFKKYELRVETNNEDFTTASGIAFAADIDSIDTNNMQRDTHLKSAEFFEADRHTQLRFTGRTYEKSGDAFKLSGDLSIRGMTKPITLDVEFAGIVVDPYGQTKAGFTVQGKISRKEFGLQWNAVTEAGQIVVSDEIRIHCEIQLVKQAASESDNNVSQVEKLAANN
ncbi:MAG: YceI family protein [Chitinophagaceae bacterium]|nr:YceI family protein [Chitinophagaceae bacterium]